MTKGKFTLGALIGAVAGFAVGILAAPKSGKETRADIKAKTDEIKADVVKKVKSYQSDASDVVEDVKDKTQDIVTDAKAKPGDLKDRTEHAAQAAKKAFFDKK